MSLELHLYQVGVEAAVRPFLGQMITPMAEIRVLNAVRTFQTEFLYKHPDYVAMESICISIVDNSVNVNAPIGTIEEYQNGIRAAKERDAIIKQWDEDRKRREAIIQKRRSSMLRRLRRLHRKYETRIPRGTKLIWESLKDYQQYNILKDIDYAVRHQCK